MQCQAQETNQRAEGEGVNSAAKTGNRQTGLREIPQQRHAREEKHEAIYNRATQGQIKPTLAMGNEVSRTLQGKVEQKGRGDRISTQTV